MNLLGILCGKKTNKEIFKKKKKKKRRNVGCLVLINSKNYIQGLGYGFA